MPRCSVCGAESDGEQCDVCGEPFDGDRIDDPLDGGDGLSRRAMLGYTGGSAAATLALTSVGWLTFVYDWAGPEEKLVKEYVAALDRQHFYTAAQLYHADAPGDPPEASDYPYLQDKDLIVEETSVPARREDIELDSVAALAFVDATIVFDSPWETEEIQTGFVVAQRPDDEWRLWRDPADLE